MKYLLFLSLLVVSLSFSSGDTFLRKLMDESYNQTDDSQIPTNSPGTCPAGYYGPNCDQSCPGLDGDNVEVSECNDAGECIEKDGKYECKCYSFAQGDACENTCEGSYVEDGKVVECNNNGKCEFVDEIPICKCKPGFHGYGCEGQCPGFKQTGDDSFIECSGNGKCEMNDDFIMGDSFSCKCHEGYFGEACDKVCPGLIEIDGVKTSCNGHGTCNNGVCVCDPGYYGKACNETCPGLLLDHDNSVLECSGHGTCNPQTLQCTCNNNRYVGEACDCVESTCGEHGKCNKYKRCECSSPYSGEFCSVHCDNDQNCNSHGVCTEEATCLCLYDYYEKDCSKHCTDEQTCSNHGSCIANGKCLCDENYEGEHCEIEITFFKQTKTVQLMIVFTFFIILLLQCYCWYNQSKTPRFAEKLTPTKAVTPANTIQMSTMSTMSTMSPVIATVPKSPIIGGWTCPACTTVNEASATKCSFCQTPKTKSTIVKPKRVKRTKKVENTEEVKSEKHDGESTIFNDDNMKITLTMKKIENSNTINIVLHFYSVKEDNLTDLAFSISAPKYITQECKPISTTQIDKDHNASQQMTFTVPDGKPLKMKIDGSYKLKDEVIEVHTGGLKLE